MANRKEIPYCKLSRFVVIRGHMHLTIDDAQRTSISSPIPHVMKCGRINIIQAVRELKKSPSVSLKELSVDHYEVYQAQYHKMSLNQSYIIP